MELELGDSAELRTRFRNTDEEKIVCVDSGLSRLPKHLPRSRLQTPHAPHLGLAPLQRPFAQLFFGFLISLHLLSPWSCPTLTVVVGCCGGVILIHVFSADLHVMTLI